MTDTRTGTRTLILTQEQLRLISQWANNAWHDADQARMMTRPNSPQEKAAEADQLFVGEILEKIRNVS